MSITVPVICISDRYCTIKFLLQTAARSKGKVVKKRQKQTVRGNFLPPSEQRARSEQKTRQIALDSHPSRPFEKGPAFGFLSFIPFSDLSSQGRKLDHVFLRCHFQLQVLITSVRNRYERGCYSFTARCVSGIYTGGLLVPSYPCIILLVYMMLIWWCVYLFTCVCRKGNYFKNHFTKQPPHTHI